jgi:flavin reductase (DIM6/NTAB) family NADH-FMN oxidoreductase RutF
LFYQPGRGHGLPRDPFKAILVPRPIGWITTISAAGVVNLAPFSFFNAISEDPPMVYFSPGGRKPDRPFKDSRINAEATGEFVVNVVSYDLREAMNATSATLPAEVSEMAAVGLTPAASVLVKPPRVAESPAHFECRHVRTIELPPGSDGGPNAMVLGEVIGVHIRDDLLRDGRVDVARLRPVARLGYSQYTVVDRQFRMQFPD